MFVDFKAAADTDNTSECCVHAARVVLQTHSCPQHHALSHMNWLSGQP